MHIGARQIRALKVKCENNYGCRWTGELGELEKHLQSCDYALLPCTNKCKNNDQIVKVLRKDLQDHLTNKCPRRQYQCPHCEETGEHQERMTSHLNTCPKVKVPCPNTKCPVIIPRCEVSTHRSTCDYESVSCKYAEVGCEERPLRKDLKSHEEDDQLHLRVTTQSVLRLQTEVIALKTMLSKANPFTFKMENFSDYKKKKKHFIVFHFTPPRLGTRCV